MMLLLHQAFDAACARVPQKTALVCGAQRSTYAELNAEVAALAAHLQAQGVQRGDRVALFLEPGLPLAAAVHAVLRCGAVFMPISPLAKADKLAYMLKDTRAVALLTEAALAAQWAPAVAQAPHLRGVVVAGHAGEGDARCGPWPAAGAAAPLAEPGTIGQDLAAIIYTSGTTGLPKGVMLSHLNMCSAWASVQAYLGLQEDDVVGLALSPAFSYGLYYLLMALGLGATLVLERNAAFPAKLLQRLQDERVTVFPGVPTLFSALLGLAHFGQADLSALRLVTNAAAALPDEHLRQWRQQVPRARFLSMYGMTECKRISYLPPEQLAQRPASVGRGMPNQECWLVDADGSRLPNGSTGELVVRGSHVMRGYWEKPEETAQRLRPGPLPGEMVLHTGDIFRTDSEGWLYFVSRSDDIIKSRGEKVAPREVENAIHALPEVAECAVVGVPDALLGQAVKAFVVLRPGSTLVERDIIRHCLARLEGYMVPKTVALVAELPRTDSGKLRRRDLA